MLLVHLHVNCFSWKVWFQSLWHLKVFSCAKMCEQKFLVQKYFYMNRSLIKIHNILHILPANIPGISATRVLVWMQAGFFWSQFKLNTHDTLSSKLQQDMGSLMWHFSCLIMAMLHESPSLDFSKWNKVWTFLKGEVNVHCLSATFLITFRLFISQLP